jgi:hypothetical protein
VDARVCYWLLKISSETFFFFLFSFRPKFQREAVQSHHLTCMNRKIFTITDRLDRRAELRRSGLLCSTTTSVKLQTCISVREEPKHRDDEDVGTKSDGHLPPSTVLRTQNERACDDRH